MSQVDKMNMTLNPLHSDGAVTDFHYIAFGISSLDPPQPLHVQRLAASLMAGLW